MTSSIFNVNSTWLYFVSLQFTIIMVISEQIIFISRRVQLCRIRDTLRQKCAFTKFYLSAELFFLLMMIDKGHRKLTRHPTDTSGHHDDRRESILFIWYLIDWTMSATIQWSRYPDDMNILKVMCLFVNVIIMHHRYSLLLSLSFLPSDKINK